MQVTGKQKILLILVFLSLITWYFAKMVPGLYQLEQQAKTNSVRSEHIKVSSLPWFGLKLENVQYDSNNVEPDSEIYDQPKISWQAPTVNLEFALRPGLLLNYNISKIIINEPIIHIESPAKFQQSLKLAKLKQQFGMPNLILNDSFKLSIHNATIKLPGFELTDVNLHTTSISEQTPFSANITGKWQQHAFKASAIFVPSPNGIKLNNLHFKLDKLSDKFGMSNIKINTDASIIGRQVKFDNFVIMTPEARLQGGLTFDILEPKQTSGALELPIAPCQNVLTSLGLKPSTDPKLLADCSGSVKWQNQLLELELDALDLSAKAKFNLAMKNDPGATLKLKGGKLAYFYYNDLTNNQNTNNLNTKASKQLTPINLNKIIHKWFTNILWEETTLGNLLIKQIKCRRNFKSLSCQLDDYNLRMHDLNSGAVRLENTNIDVLLKALGTSTNNLNGKIFGTINWSKQPQAFAYKARLRSPELIIKNWPTTELLQTLNKQNLRLKIQKADGQLHKLQNIKIKLQGLNDILNFNEISFANIKANGILDIASGALAIDIKQLKQEFNLIGNWPDALYILLVNII